MGSVKDNISFDPQKMPYGAEDCGCYIDGEPEWCIGLWEEDSE